MRVLRYCILMAGILLSHGVLAQGASIDPACIPIDRAGYVIDKPGRYCVVKDLYTRLDFADHSAEPALIEIKSSDVTLDLRGHRLGKGWSWFPTQPSSNGIDVGGRNYHFKNYQNILIKNGSISNAQSGVYFRREHKLSKIESLPRSLRLIEKETYIYETANIVIKDVVFERCKENFSFNDWADSREMFLREKDASNKTPSP